VLVVDDEPEVLDAYRRVLEPSANFVGAAVIDELRNRLLLSGGSPALLAKPSARPNAFDTTYCDGEVAAIAAVRAANSANKPFTIVFLDSRLSPGQDALRTAQRIRAIDQKVEIVICAADTDVDPLRFSRHVLPADKLFYLPKPFEPHELRHMTVALGEKYDCLNRRTVELTECDSLTGLPSRGRFVARLGEAIDDARRQGQSMALLYLDLDGFRCINDALGQAAGDQMLKQISRRLREMLYRDAVMNATGADDLAFDVARLGGDEFVVLIRALKDVAEAGAIAQHLTSPLLTAEDAVRTTVMVTASVGIALYPTDSTDDDALLRQASIAMYAAKRQGRGRVAFFDATMKAGALARFNLEQRLQRALARGGLSLDYQPQFNLGTGEISGVEALLRWTDAELGSVAPEEFVPLAEEMGLIMPIGEWALRTACNQFRLWLDTGLDAGRVAVNVSPAQFAQPGFCRMVAAALADTGLAPARLELEITESLALRDDGRTSEILADLRQIGVSLAIDDFGMGHSNLGRLSSVPVSRLKIDRALVQGSDSAGRAATIVGTIVSMARSLGLEVVAEGVEDFTQLLDLQEQQCNEVQGYLLSKPLSADEATQLLQRLDASCDTSRTTRLRSLAG
jgi:diguanylate cyclase (GGDEF)-like protein